MSDARDETTGDGCHLAVAVKIALALLYLLLVQQAHLAPLAVGKAVDDGTSKIIARHIIDGSTEVGAKGCKQNYKKDVKITCCCVISRGRHHKL